MSWGTCYQGSNNIHYNFPPIMNDGRNFSSYEPGTAIDNILKDKSNVKTNLDYRRYLQNNADSIIKNNQLNACDECSACPHIDNSNPILNSNDNNQLNQPYIFNSILSNNQPYGYETSDLKNIYISRQQLEAKMHAPRINIDTNENN
tara:strand:- start:9201 stop:9641 length:441 start_codon:yes stop_codon:yes gene_type:complete